jgi:hypothetical protein
MLVEMLLKPTYLTMIPDQDAYATKAFFGVIYGPDLFKTENGMIVELSGQEIKSLVLSRLEMAYHAARKEIEEM